ncbi:MULTISPECIES: DUF1097 family protein [unclassified Nocardioides]|uniref:DUF1097 family protein n=1 Tax=unclassified Nocardioides TaxID=2615069 RepID=UPI0000465731|nr:MULTISPECIES: DUF1097 family protein [unclassified Nocardioides]AAV52088.1 hypothetical protein [Nocardioides sp. JS614]ABL79388.1 hypothetical protein Noca_4804 [Nocardioides sp. JS614]
MLQRIRGALPLSLAIALLAFAWVEVSLNFTFHWVTSGDLGVGLELPSNLQLITPAAFIAWAVFFAAGADSAALAKTVVSSIVGATAALLLMLISPKLAELPDFWSIALVIGVLVFAAVMLTVTGDGYYVPGVFVAFAAVVFWWFATGLDGWAVNGGGVGNSIAALGKPETAGTGAFGGVFSTPVEWVYISSLVSLVCGSLLGVASVRLAGALGFLAGKPAAETVDA